MNQIIPSAIYKLGGSGLVHDQNYTYFLYKCMTHLEQLNYLLLPNLIVDSTYKVANGNQKFRTSTCKYEILYHMLPNLMAMADISDREA